MLLYRWKKIYEIAEGNPLQCVLILKMMSEGQIPRNDRDPIYKYYIKDFRGSSFLAHDDVLFYNRHKHTNTEIAQYAALASLRSLADYYAFGTTTLDLFHVPMDKSLFSNNSLLYIDDDNLLHFLYEEAPQEKHKWH